MPESNASLKTPKTVHKPKVRSFPIIGIGGSAGAFTALRTFFTHMPADSGMSFVIVMHLDPDHKGQLADVIKGYTSMNVVEASDGLEVEPDTVYVIPPNKDMGIHNRKLLLLSLAAPRASRQPIDYFFQSLADDQWNRAVGIILSGMGSDGETGVRMIKEKLGVVMVQDPQVAEYNSMPLASISTNLVDYVVSPEEMPLKLIQYLNHPVMSDEPSEQVRNEIRNSTSIQKILMLLRTNTGHDFSLYKKSTVVRRIDRRIAFHQLPDYVQYVNHLRENPGEIDVLFNELLIGVTKFFRDKPAFESLQNKLNNIIETRSSEGPIRVWIAGCSTGEEAYSVAILLIECLQDPPQKKLPRIQIFATDLDPEAIEHARRGVYYSNIGADVSEERLNRFFLKSDGGYMVKKELREMIVFAQHNLIKDAPFTRVDLICCRNVMIYFTSDLQKKIMPLFHYSLNPKGLLFMGPAETIGGFTELFVSIDPKWKIFERREDYAQATKLLDFPFHVGKQPPNVALSGEPGPMRAKFPAAEIFNKTLLEDFSPPAVLINEKGDVLYTNGDTDPFLQMPRGEAVMNIDKLARENLRYVLGNIIHQARLQDQKVSVHNVKFAEGKSTRLVSLHARKVNMSEHPGLLLIAFEDKGIQKKAPKNSSPGETVPLHIARDLEKELVYTKQQLHSTIEQMETSLEELKSTNEELQSTNEELQSTNEESLTTKEEMQSLNEELMTINTQYQTKAEELNRLGNDMKNLLDATEIGTIFLDNDLQILRYTPKIKNIFNVIPTDVGRPLSDIVSNFDYAPLENMIAEVLERLISRELEVKTKEASWYSVRIMPYRTQDNFISGVVLTFANITAYKQLSYKTEALHQYSAGLLGMLNQPALQLDEELQVITANKHFLGTFDFSEGEVQGAAFPVFALRYWKIEGLAELLKPGKVSRHNFRYNSDDFEMVVNPFHNGEGGEALTVLVLFRKMERNERENQSRRKD